MATADQVKALIRSHADGDDSRFYTIAMQLAPQAPRSGHGRFAYELLALALEERRSTHAPSVAVNGAAA